MNEVILQALTVLVWVVVGLLIYKQLSGREK